MKWRSRKGTAELEAVRRHRPVGAEDVEVLQFFHESHRLFVERLGGRGVVEVEVGAREFVAAFAAEEDPDGRRGDVAAQEVHRRARPDGRGVVGLDGPDDFRDGADHIRFGHENLVVFGA
jgi:hypothetical protein